MLKRWRLRDPCATYYFARTLAALEHRDAMDMFRRAVEGGFHCYGFYTRDPWLDRLRTASALREIIGFAEQQYRDAAEALIGAGGERILGRPG